MEKRFEPLWASVHAEIEAAGSTDIYILETTRGLSAIVDGKYRQQVSRFRWWAVVSGGDHTYAVAKIGGKRIALQRYITHLEDPSKPLDQIKNVTFKNKITLDCRATNLLKKSSRQSVMRNRRPKRNTTSKYKGVHKAVIGKQTKWKSQIKWELGSMSLGTHTDEVSAAEIYDAAAMLLFDGSGMLNFPNRQPTENLINHARARIERFKKRKAAQGK